MGSLFQIVLVWTRSHHRRGLHLGAVWIQTPAQPGEGLSLLGREFPPKAAVPGLSACGLLYFLS